MPSPLRRELKNKDKTVNTRLKGFAESHEQHYIFLACHAVFPMILTSELIYSIWRNFQFDCNGHPLNIPWIAVPDILLSGLFEESWNDFYQVDSLVRDELIAKLELDPRFGPRRVQELAQFLLAYIQHQPKPLDIDSQDFITAQLRTALVYLEPNVVAHELALSLAQEYRRDASEVIRLGAQIETLSRPLKNANYESLVTYAWGMRELIYAEKSSKFSGLIQLDRNPEEIRAEFQNLLSDEPLNILLSKEEKLSTKHDKSIFNIISQARNEAKRFNHTFVNPEHLLLSILSQADHLATKSLNQKGISFEKVNSFLNRAKIAYPANNSTHLRKLFSFSTFKALPLSTLSKRVLAFSRYIANQLGDNFIDAEHLILGILQDGENLASVLLERSSINQEELQNKFFPDIGLNTYYIAPELGSEPDFDSYSQRAVEVLKSVKISSPTWSYRIGNHENYSILRSSFVNTEKILLELVKTKHIASILATCTDSTIEEVRTKTQEKANSKLLLFDDENIFTARARKALSYAKEECLYLNHSKIDTYHLLLGCLREQDNAASTLLLHLKTNHRQLCTLLRNQATLEEHERKSVVAIKVLSRLDIDPKELLLNVHLRLQTLEDLASDTVGNGIQILTDLGVDVCEVRSQIVARFEALDQFATDSDGKSGQLLSTLGVDVCEVRSQVVRCLEILEQFGIDCNGKTGEIFDNLGMDLSELRASLKLRMK